MKINDTEKLIDKVKSTIEDSGMLQLEVAKKAKLEKGIVSRMLLKKHTPNLDTFAKVCTAVGLELTLIDKPKKPFTNKR